MKRAKMIVATIAIVGGIAWAAGPAHAQESAQSLVYAVYETEAGAMNAFKSLEQAQKEQVVHLQSYAVVSKDANGKVHVQRSNQKKGTIAGVVVGGLIGALGGPVGAVAGMAAGGVVGRAGGEAMGIPTEDIKAAKDTLTPGSSALIAVLDERWVSDLSRSLHQTNARRVLDTKIQQGTAGAPAENQPSPSPSPQP